MSDLPFCTKCESQFAQFLFRHLTQDDGLDEALESKEKFNDLVDAIPAYCIVYLCLVCAEKAGTLEVMLDFLDGQQDTAEGL